MGKHWSEDRIDDLKARWAKGETASDIASAMGPGVTRNMVIGKARRLGLEARPSPIKGGN